MAQWIQRLNTGTARTIAAFVVVALLVTGGALTLRAKNDDSVVARVNGVAITKGELFDEMYRRDGGQTLEKLISILLIQQEADAKGVTVSDDDVSREIADLANRVGGVDQLDFLLFQQQMTMDDLVEETRILLFAKALISPDIVIDEDEVRQVFEENIDFFEQGEQVRARHILVDTKDEAEELRKRLLDGEDFAELAREHSTDLGSGANGGDLGWFGRGVMVAPFEQAAFALAVGDISPLVESQFGYHIIRVDERAEAKPAQFDEEAATFIRETIMEQEVQQRLPMWLSELHAAADVELLFDN